MPHDNNPDADELDMIQAQPEFKPRHWAIWAVDQGAPYLLGWADGKSFDHAVFDFYGFGARPPADRRHFPNERTANEYYQVHKND